MKMNLTLLACALAAGGFLFASPIWAQAGGGGPAGRAASIRPPAPPGWIYVWVAPVYRTVMDQVWVAETRQLVPVWMETSPGRMEQVYREIVTPGYWRTSSRQELASAGRYELVRVDPPVIVLPPRIVVNPGTVGVEGYARGGPVEDLSKFSGLAEWPK